MTVFSVLSFFTYLQTPISNYMQCSTLVPRGLLSLRSYAATAFLVFSTVLPAAQAQVPQPPEIAARSYLLLDVTANQILAAKDIYSPVEPASLTNLMTEYLVFDALKSKKITLEQTFSVSERAWKMPGSRMFIDP